MVNGKKGDHPLSDILHYGIQVFSPDIDAMVRELSDSDTFVNVIAREWLLDWSGLLYLARKDGHVAYGKSNIDEETILNAIRNVLRSELRRVRQKRGLRNAGQEDCCRRGDSNWRILKPGSRPDRLRS